MGNYNVTGRLASAVANAGTFTASYPTNTDSGTFIGAVGHQLVVAQNLYAAPTTFSLTFGTADITVTNKSGAAWAAGSDFILGLQIAGQVERASNSDFEYSSRVSKITDGVYLLNLGAADTADTDSMVKAATSTELPNATTTTYTPDTNGTTPTDGVQPTVDIGGVTYWSLDVPRNISCLTTHGSSIVAMTIVVTGKDEYLNNMSETITVAATGTSEVDAGLKAFKYVRSVAITSAGNATTNTLNVGFADLIGLPMFLRQTGFVVKEMQDGATATAGTLVAGIQLSGGSTATSGDVRGTYDPNAAADGAKAFSLIVNNPDPDYLGQAQYTA